MLRAKRAMPKLPKNTSRSWADNAITSRYESLRTNVTRGVWIRSESFLEGWVGTAFFPPNDLPVRRSGIGKPHADSVAAAPSSGNIQGSSASFALRLSQASKLSSSWFSRIGWSAGWIPTVQPYGNFLLLQEKHCSASCAQLLLFASSRSRVQ